MRNILIIILTIASTLAHSQCTCLTPVSVPIEIGQSNANGTGGLPNFAPANVGSANIWNVDGATETAFVTNDPLVLGTGGNSGSGNLVDNFSAGTIYAQNLSTWSSLDVFMFKLARGNTRIAQWNAPGQILETFTTQWALFEADLASKCLRPIVDKVIWIQGESDATTDNANYYADLELLYNNINTVIGTVPEWSIVPLSDQFYVNNPTATQTVQNDQLQFCQDNLIVNCVDVSGLTYQDAVHYDAASIVELSGRVCNRNNYL